MTTTRIARPLAEVARDANPALSRYANGMYRRMFATQSARPSTPSSRYGVARKSFHARSNARGVTSSGTKLP
jgi:hypothetical protein